jgi:hypothetical protein
MSLTKRICSPRVPWFLATGLCFCLPISAVAQHAQFEETTVKLQTKVKIHLGPTTVDQVMASLSEQTGLTIEAADYLRQHHLSVEIAGMAASDVLSTLAECNDWIWRESDRGRIILSRPSLKAPESLPEIAVALHRALPKDMRRYLNIDQVMANPDFVNADRRVFDRQNVGSNAKDTPQLRRNVVTEWTTRLYNSLQPKISDGKAIRFDNLTSQQRQALIRSLILFALELSNRGLGHDLLSMKLNPFESDFSTVEIGLKGGTMSIGSSVVEGNLLHTTSFGAPLNFTFNGRNPFASPK